MRIDEIEIKEASAIFAEDQVTLLNTVLNEGEETWSAPMSIEQMFEHIDSVINK